MSQRYDEAFPMHPNDSAALKADRHEVRMELWDNEWWNVEGYCPIHDSFDCDHLEDFPTRPPDLELLSE